MYIQDWSPKIGANSVSPTHIYEPFLQFTGILRCPVCNHEKKAETSGHLVGGFGTLTDNINWEFKSFTKKRVCANCGIVSAVPKAEREKILQEASELVTIEWIKQQVENLKASAKKTLERKTS